jgi:hypothetical protein
MPEALDAELLERLDAAIADGGRLLAELRAIRAVIAAPPPAPAAEGNGFDASDDEALLDTHSAAERTGYARDTIALWCRTVPGVGVWKGGRWQVRIAALRRHLDRKNNQ